MTVTTTLNAIRAQHPCKSGWVKLLAHLGKTQADDEPLPLTTILDSNGLDDALWCLRAVEGFERETRLFAVWCARRVQHLMTDPRSIDALNVAERFANGEVSLKELHIAKWGARYAADDAEATAAAAGATAAKAALYATGKFAWIAAQDAAFAARSAARDVAGAVTQDFAADSAMDAAWNAAQAAQANHFREIFG